MAELDNNILFVVTVEELQNEARQRIGRELTEDEIILARKGIEHGLSFDIQTVFSAVIEDAVSQ